jgi:hypothetical protein
MIKVLFFFKITSPVYNLSNYCSAVAFEFWSVKKYRFNRVEKWQHNAFSLSASISKPVILLVIRQNIVAVFKQTVQNILGVCL